MESLTLDLDAVVVETLDAGAVPRIERGTVQANEDFRPSRLDACPSSRGCTEISPC